MIELMFRHIDNNVIVIIKGNTVLFGDTSQGSQLSTIDGLKLNRIGVIREFPELKNDYNWKEKAIILFKEKIKSFKTEEETSDYLINDLKFHGYIPRLKKVQGFRPVIIK